MIFTLKNTKCMQMHYSLTLTVLALEKFWGPQRRAVLQRNDDVLLYIKVNDFHT